MGLEERNSAQAGPARAPARTCGLEQMLGIGVVASILGIAARPADRLVPASPPPKQAKPIDTLWDVLIISSVPVFVGVDGRSCCSRRLKFRMRPGEEHLDGPPIHGNTRLEVIWTAIPAILLVGLCTYAFIVLEDVEKAQANTHEGARRRRAVRVDVLLHGRDGGKEVRSTQLHLPMNRPVQVHAPVQGRAARLLGARLPHEEGRGARHQRHAIASRRTAKALPDRLRRALRPGPRHDARHRRRGVRGEVHEPGSAARQARGGAAAGGGGRAGGDGAGRQAASSPRHGCGSCHTLADAGSTGTAGPNLDEGLTARTWPFIRQSIADPGAEITDGYTRQHMPPGFEQTWVRQRSMRW